MANRTPAEHALVPGDAGSTPWAEARERLEAPERDRTYWMATIQPDGRPHPTAPGLWLDDAFYFVTGETTRKGKTWLEPPTVGPAVGALGPRAATASRTRRPPVAHRS
jgi:hypothetical protein